MPSQRACWDVFLEELFVVNLLGMGFKKRKRQFVNEDAFMSCLNLSNYSYVCMTRVRPQSLVDLIHSNRRYVCLLFWQLSIENFHVCVLLHPLTILGSFFLLIPYTKKQNQLIMVACKTQTVGRRSSRSPPRTQGLLCQTLPHPKKGIWRLRQTYYQIGGGRLWGLVLWSFALCRSLCGSSGF